LDLDKSPSEWPTLVPQLYTFCESEDVAHREVGVYVLYTLFDVIADSYQDIKSHIVPFLQLFSKTLNDQSLLVAVSTVQALGKVSEFIDNGEDALIVIILYL
jgi:HEAT repeat protein